MDEDFDADAELARELAELGDDPSSASVGGHHVEDYDALFSRLQGKKKCAVYSFLCSFLFIHHIYQLNILTVKTCLDV